MKQNPIFKVAERELKLIFSRKSTYVMLLFFPITLFLTYALVYQVGSLNHLPVAVWDADHSPLSRTLIRSIESTSAFNITENPASLDELKTLMESRDVHAAFYIPKNFEKDIKSGNSVNVVVYKNATNIVVSNVVLKNAATVIKTVSAGVLIKKLQAKGNTYEKSYSITNALKVNSSPLFNPHYNYENYTVPGLLVFTLQMIIMLSGAIVLNTEFEDNKINELLRISRDKTGAILLGKFSAHFLLNAFSAILMIGIVFPLFSIQVNSSYLLVLLYVFFFNIVSISLGFMISAIVKDKLLASEIAIVINTPAFIFSGFTFPIWGMPSLHSAIANILPFTHFLNGFVKLYQMNTPIASLLPEVLILLLFLLISTLITYLFLRKRITNSITDYTSVECTG